MSRVSDARRRRAAVSMWVRWLPLLLIPFSVLFSETWLQIQVFRHDYEAHKLNKSLREAQERIKSFRNEEASMNRFDRLDAEAPNLGLVEPEANQIVVLKVGATQLAKGTTEYSQASAPGPTPY